MKRSLIYSTRHIPKNSTEVKGPEELNCVAYIYPFASERRPQGVAALGYGGRRNKPDFHYTFKDESAARAHIAAYFAGQQQTAALRKKLSDERKAAICRTPLEVWNKARSGGYISAPDAAVCLRAVLAKEFPGVKFSVRADRSLNVDWTDGPSSKAVEAIAHNYRFEGFDGMVDCRYNIRRWLSQDGRMSVAHDPNSAGGYSESEEAATIGDPHDASAVLVKHGPDFVFVHRSISPEIKRELAAKVCARYGIDMPEKFDDEIAFERFLNTARQPDTNGFRGEYLSTLVHQASTGVIAI